MVKHKLIGNLKYGMKFTIFYNFKNVFVKRNKKMQ